MHVQCFLTSINNYTPYQVSFSPSNIFGQYWEVSISEIWMSWASILWRSARGYCVVVFEICAKQRFRCVRAYLQVVASKCGQHQLGDVVVIWDGFHTRVVLGGEDACKQPLDDCIIVRSPGRGTCARRRQVVRMHVPYLVVQCFSAAWMESFHIGVCDRRGRVPVWGLIFIAEISACGCQQRDLDVAWTIVAEILQAKWHCRALSPQ